MLASMTMTDTLLIMHLWKILISMSNSFIPKSHQASSFGHKMMTSARFQLRTVGPPSSGSTGHSYWLSLDDHGVLSLMWHIYWPYFLLIVSDIFWFYFTLLTSKLTYWLFFWHFFRGNYFSRKNLFLVIFVLYVHFEENYHLLNIRNVKSQ